jgi:hypothetical protein
MYVLGTAGTELLRSKLVTEVRGPRGYKGAFSGHVVQVPKSVVYL